jgi:hypothetical protein
MKFHGLFLYVTGIQLYISVIQNYIILLRTNYATNQEKTVAYLLHVFIIIDCYS